MPICCSNLKPTRLLVIFHRVRITLPIPPDFDFLSSICSHGFFVLAPNNWSPQKQTLYSVVTLDEQKAIPINIKPSTDGRVLVQSQASVNAEQRKVVRAAIRRMLRIDEDLSDFHCRCLASRSHRKAATMRFGRLLRSASLFEDVIKVMCTCNTGWTQTVAMVENLVRYYGVPADNGECGFPTPSRLADVSPNELKRKGRLGYRAAYVHQLACEVAEGKRTLSQYENFTGPSRQLARQLQDINGVGPYAAGHLCMLLGRYDILAMDTEMSRFFRQKHPRRKATLQAVQHYYRHWHPWQFLAYWYELWSDYVRRHGRSDQWSPQITGVAITSRPR